MKLDNVDEATIYFERKHFEALSSLLGVLVSISLLINVVSLLEFLIVVRTCF